MGVSRPDLELPKTIGRYAVLRLVGEGAMGRVLLAHDPVLDRDVALKHLRDDLQIPRDVRDGLVVRMRHEARAAARVAHPNIVTLHDMGEDERLGLYLVFEYVEGPTLKDRLLDGPLSARETARLARELGAALTVAHRAGIVHRDVKPDNVILSSSGAKIADFGIAKIPDSTLTHQGGLLGTPAYGAPETFRSGRFSAESDQFSLAATMYEAVSGRRAFPGDDAAIVATKIQNERPLLIATPMRLPAAVDDTLQRAMAKEPEGRFPSCEAFGDALADILEQFAGPSRSFPPPPVPAQQPDVSATPAFVARPSAPQERKTGQVVLGATVVVVTAALLVRTALRSAETANDDTPVSTSSTAAAGSGASARPRPSPPPPIVPPPTPQSTLKPRPKTSAEPSSTPDASVAPVPPPSASVAVPAVVDAGATTTPAKSDGGP